MKQISNEEILQLPIGTLIAIGNYENIFRIINYQGSGEDKDTLFKGITIFPFRFVEYSSTFINPEKEWCYVFEEEDLLDLISKLQSAAQLTPKEE